MTLADESHRSRLQGLGPVATAKRRECGLHAVAESGGLADWCVMIRGDVDVRTAQVSGESPLQPRRHPPVLGEHDDGAR
jgi:hypothetical protein